MPLSNIQLQTAAIILALPEASGFALAGGAALVLHEVVDRGTKDLDCFGPSTTAVNHLVAPCVEALEASGFETELLFKADGFAKLLVVIGNERTQVDLGFDPCSHAPIHSDVGPVRHIRDLAGDKLLALFARAAPRDFVDVAALLKRFTTDELCSFALTKDRGFTVDVLADAFGVLPTYDRASEFSSLGDPQYAELLATFAAWRQQIMADPTP